MRRAGCVPPRTIPTFAPRGGGRRGGRHAESHLDGAGLGDCPSGGPGAAERRRGRRGRRRGGRRSRGGWRSPGAGYTGEPFGGGQHSAGPGHDRAGNPWGARTAVGRLGGDDPGPARHGRRGSAGDRWAEWCVPAADHTGRRSGADGRDGDGWGRSGRSRGRWGGNGRDGDWRSDGSHLPWHHFGDSVRDTPRGYRDAGGAGAG